MPVAASVTSVAASKPKNINHDFSNYVPLKITLYPDGEPHPKVQGGTIKMEGAINRTFTGDVRFDGALGSPTRGQFFVTIKSKTAGPERPMKKSDLRELRQAIARHMGNPKSNPAYGVLLRNIDRVLGAKPVKWPTAAHLKKVLGAWEFHNAKFTLNMPPQLIPEFNDVAKQYTLAKPPAGMVGGTTVKAYLLKDQPEKVVFEKNIGGRPYYLGPVSYVSIPK